jgi:hypothetical protein
MLCAHTIFNGTVRIRSVGVLVAVAGIALLLGGCPPQEQPAGQTAPEPEGPKTFDSATDFEPGTVAISMIPEDTRVAWVTDEFGSAWDFFGTRTPDGEIDTVDRVEVSHGDRVLIMHYDEQGRVIRMEAYNTSTGESKALTFRYVGGDEVEVEGYEAFNAEDPAATGTITLPASGAEATSRVLRVSSDWRAGVHRAEERALQRAMERRELQGVKPLTHAEAAPITEVKGTFRVKVEEVFSEVPETDATVEFTVQGDGKDVRVIGTHTGGGVYEASVTLRKAADISQLIKECDRMAAIGKLLVDNGIRVLGVVGGGAAGGASSGGVGTGPGAGIGLALAELINKFKDAMGETLQAAVLTKYVSEAFEKGTCSGVVDITANLASGNYQVSAKVIASGSRPEVVGSANSPVSVPIVQLATGQQTLWQLPVIDVPEPPSGGLSNVNIGARQIELTFRDTGTEDGDEVRISIKNGKGEERTIFTGVLTNAGETLLVILDPGRTASS